MAKPKVFVSSTYLDLKEIRSSLGDFFQNIGFDSILFERGGVFYDPAMPLDQSCYQEVGDCDLFVLVIGGRYGSPASLKTKAALEGFNSVTKTEFLTARDAGIPIYTFIRTQVHNEYETYRKLPANLRDTFSYAQVDNVLVFRLIEDVYALNRGNPIFSYETSSEIIHHLKAQLAGMWNDYLKGKKETQKRKPQAVKTARINAYKLFFFRSEASLSFGELSKRTGIDKKLLRKLEIVDKKHEYLEPGIFNLCGMDVIEKLEETLDCHEMLRVGRADDFLSVYIQYYLTYKGKTKPSARHGGFERSLFPTRAVVFDFDGTLTQREEDLTTWEKIWTSLGYDINECSSYLRKFTEKKISHAQWCDITCEKFREKNLRESQLFELAKTIKLVPGTGDVLRTLYEGNIKLYIVSGSIRQVIKQVLGNLHDLFEDIKANDMIFNKDGKLMNIKGTKYDFEGKAEYLKKIIHENGYSPLEVLYVGNSLNDVWASQSGVKTLCVNPRFTDPNRVEHWSYYLRKMDDLHSIMPFINMT